MYLSSLKSLITIIMKFVSMAAIVKFDNMYAAALFEEKMLAAKGKLLPTQYKRRMAKRRRITDSIASGASKIE